jgi:hypothetical protein
MKDVHPMYPQSHLFLRREMNHVNAGKRSRQFNHDTLDFRPASHPVQHKDILDSSLEILRKLTEFKRLKEDLSVIPTRQPYLQVNQYPSQSNNAHATPPEFYMQDLKIIGYKGIVCQSCLIAHPLAIYQVKDRPGVKPIMTRHSCNAERLSEIQQQQSLNKQDILADLQLHQLPRLILESAKKWTKDDCTLTAIEVAAPFEGYPLIDLLDQKEWADLAVRNGFVILTNEQLEDFIHIVKLATCAYFKIVVKKGNEKSCRIFFMSLRRSYSASSY